ncbi:MAG: ribosomal protein S18-alanine N-acetyltransferase [Scytonematopsis contorta HA4267-MV1]|nr:ribosomal protein S18-alanine N-acetyltransferase [Scytonematopsis contorta HA4267-MV1]
MQLILELKPLTSDDLSSVLEIDKACFGGLWTLSGYQREIDSPNSDLIGMFSTQPAAKLLGIGCFWSILEEAHITLVAVHPQYQRQGFGQVLVYSLLVTAMRRGLERATLEVRASNQTAISLYQKFGFKTAGRRRRYYQDNDEDALILWLSGLQSPQIQENLTNWQQNMTQRLLKSGMWLKVDA